MAVYKDKQELQAILSRLWERIFNTASIVEKLADLSMVVEFRFTDIQTRMFIVAGSGRREVLWDPATQPKADVEMILATDTGHAFWMEELNVPLALASRKIVAKGSVQKALKLLPALKPAFAIYPQVLAEMGRNDLLLRKKSAGRKKKWLTLPGFSAPKKIARETLPVFPMNFAEARRSVTLSKETDKSATPLDLYRTMVTIRAFEQHLSDGFRNGEIPSEAIHLSIGQEAVAAGVCLKLRNSDYINTTHRGHGHIIAKGTDLKKMMAELYGKADGLCEGKGGSMHVTDGSLGILGANGIVGAGFLLALGAAQTIRYLGRDDISVVFAGDGAVNQGMFHEALNMAAVFRLPLLVIIENNLYGEFTSIERHSAETDIRKRMAAYNIETEQLDGNDVTTVFKRVGEILQAMRGDGKPRGIELKTYRWHGHMEGEPELYRSEEEKQVYRLKDPIVRLEKELVEKGLCNKEKLAAIRSEVNQQIQEAAEFAKKAAEPEKMALTSRIYSPDPAILFHGEIGPTPPGPVMSYSQAINKGLEEEMNRDERIFLWGEDVRLGGYFSVTEGLVEKMGEKRIIDTPISEYAIVGGAVGAAMTGLRPVCEILFGDFLTCCMDPILNQAAKLRYMTGGQVSIPLTIRTPVGSGIGMAAQHSQSMERFFFGIPGLIVVAPSDPYTAKGLLKTAIRSDNPVLFFEHKLLYASTGPVPAEEYILPLGKARVVRKGRDLTLVTHLIGVSAALEAAQILMSQGIEMEVIDLVTLYPMDHETLLESISRTRGLVTLEEGTATGGIGAEVISRVCLGGFALLKRPPLRLAAPECPIPYAKTLENAMMPNPQTIAAAVSQWLGK
ncbi:MAG: pyruvate dehydrogenase complex E1 component subunit beta [Desulfobacteraceae bacterium]|nr:pyruvate dehydrogenase complex E1 component subunit beta [Desulfobacteraceae bacterium]